MPNSLASRRHNEFARIPVVALGMLMAVVLISIIPEWISPSSPTAISIAQRLKPPMGFGGTFDHILGTDQLGRDILARLIFGAQVSIAVGFLSVLGAGLIGLILGLVSGFFRGAADAIIMRLAEIMLSIPAMLLALALIASLGPSLRNLIIVLIALNWARYARLVRGEVLRLRERGFVQLARVAGSGPIRILWTHIFPNVLNPTLVLASLDLGRIIILEASMSFLGVGVPPPTPSWGLMMSDGRGYITTAWWLTLFPGLFILLTCLAMNRIGDWMRDRLDPRLRAD